ncbi:engulfment and cell motility protein 1-like [Amphibalanus amphitrite]|uniref:engulfment and cell motility protein 1-like n=1 Tax=Amphibalanus amphitrite TaxID=1232801 RepID=UPI001C915AE1|nr:engulfment and cell motility protein 1-like [Amphibalanus amphitrite]
MPESSDASVVKIAVQMDGKQPILTEFDLRLPLHKHVLDLANSWGLADSTQYALKFTDNAERYITEKNKLEVRNGSVLYMDVSPARASAAIVQQLGRQSPDILAAEGLETLCRLSTDPTFAAEFVCEQGLQLLVAGIEHGRFVDAALANALTSFLELMEHGIVLWDSVEPSLVSRVASEVNRLAAEHAPSRAADRTSRISERCSQIDLQTPPNRLSVHSQKTLRAALAILESVIVNVPERHELIGDEIEMSRLVTHLQRSDATVQQNALALINALFARADGERKGEYTTMLNSKGFRNVIQTYVINLKGGNDLGEELAHQLYVLQTLNLNLLETRMRTPVRPEDSDVLDKIKELRKLALDDETKGSTNRKPGSFAKDYQQLGFQDGINPANDFGATPPGVLALDCMLYLARWQRELYTRLVLENSCGSDHECPFGRTSIRLAALLCDILKVGVPPSDEGNTFYPMFFTQDRPFEEFFCICINLLNKTWKEMRATAEDFDKVMSVVREQITRALHGGQKLADGGGGKHEPQSRPDPPATLEAFRNRLNTYLTYSQINAIWQQEQNTKEEWESQARPIVELREQITPEMLELIQKQRLIYMVEGTRFTKYTARGQRVKDKFWMVRLSPNHKVLHYGDCSELATPTLDELTNKLAVHEVRALVTGRDCPHMKDSKGKKSTFQLAFSLLYESPEGGSLDFVAPDGKTFDYWTDGINALLGKKMSSEEARRDLDMLLAMEIKLRLLDTDGLEIPQEPPPIPPDPPNYDFCCD